MGKQRKSKRKKYIKQKSLEIIKNLSAIGDPIQVERESYGLSYFTWDRFICKCGNNICFNAGFHPYFLVQCTNCSVYYKFDFQGHPDNKESGNFIKAVPVLPNLFDPEIKRYLTIIPSNQNPCLNLFLTGVKFSMLAVLNAEQDFMNDADKEFMADEIIKEDNLFVNKTLQ